MPAPTPPSPGKQLFDGINQQLAQINSWIRTFSADSGWINPTLLNGWKQITAQPVEYRLTRNVVRLRGVAEEGTAAKPLFVLPEGYRPTITEGYVLYNGRESPARLVIFFNGEVVIESFEGVVALSGVTFTID
jgi:hypothetical protein